MAKRSPGPVLVKPHPGTHQEAESNLFAFLEEVRGQNEAARCSDLLPVTGVPRMRRCYGWMQFTGEELYQRMPRKVRPPHMGVGKVKRSIREDVHYTAIIYEFVEEGENSPDAVQPVLDFFWRAGFGHGMTPKADNWKSGVLVELSDIVHPNGYGWEESLFRYRTVGQIIRW